jgi:hypothetical protein
LRKLCRLAILLGGVGSLHTSVFFSLRQYARVSLREELLTVMKGDCRCAFQRIHVPLRAFARVRVHVRPRQPHPSGQFLHRELRRQVPAVRSAVHDLYRRWPERCAHTGLRSDRRTSVRLPHTHLADIRWRQELHLHPADGKALVRRDAWNGAEQGIRIRCAGAWARDWLQPADHWTQHWYELRRHRPWPSSWRGMISKRGWVEGYIRAKAGTLIALVG